VLAKEIGLANAESFLGAVASGAGDDVHEQWVAHEILRLLDPSGETPPSPVPLTAI
jgi:hypothetical protein